MKDIITLINDFIHIFEGMETVPYIGDGYCLKGRFDFRAEHSLCPIVEDVFELEILIPSKFPKDLPLVKEIGGRIPRNSDFHINYDDTICLGSPLSLAIYLSNKSSLVDFAFEVIIPYLYAVTLKLKYDRDFIFGELAHGAKGLYQDYSGIFGLIDNSQILQAFECLIVKKRLANKKQCPCGCGNRLGRCTYRFKINNLRKTLFMKKIRQIYYEYKFNHLGSRYIDRNENRGGHAFNRSHRFRCI